MIVGNGGGNSSLVAEGVVTLRSSLNGLTGLPASTAVCMLLIGTHGPGWEYWQSAVISLS